MTNTKNISNSDNTKNSNTKNGNVNISDEVLVTIVQTSAMEVDGVAEVTNSIASDIISMISKKIQGKSIELVDQDEKISVNLAINIKMGYKIMEVAQKVQSKVKNAIEIMTGLDVSKVNVDVVSVKAIN